MCAVIEYVLYVEALSDLIRSKSQLSLVTTDAPSQAPAVATVNIQIKFRGELISLSPSILSVAPPTHLSPQYVIWKERFLKPAGA